MECVIFACIWLGARLDGWWDDWVRRLEFGFSNPVVTREFGTCVCVWVAMLWVVLGGVD